MAIDDDVRNRLKKCFGPRTGRRIFFSFWEKFRKIGGADKPGEIVRLVASLLPPYKRYVLCLVLSLSLSLALTHTLSLSLTLSSAIVHLRTRTNARAHALALSHMLRKLEENSSHPEFLLPDLRSHFIFSFFLVWIKKRFNRSIVRFRQVWEKFRSLGNNDKFLFPERSSGGSRSSALEKH